MARCEDGFLLYFKSNGVLEPTESMYHGWTEPGVEAVFHILYRRPGQVGVSTQNINGIKNQGSMSMYKVDHRLSTSTKVEKVADSARLTSRKYFQKLGLTENIWENILGKDLLLIKIQV